MRSGIDMNLTANVYSENLFDNVPERIFFTKLTHNSTRPLTAKLSALLFLTVYFGETNPSSILIKHDQADLKFSQPTFIFSILRLEAYIKMTHSPERVSV